MRLLLPLLLIAARIHAAEIHVAPGGSDRHPGTAEAPLATLGAARDAARPFLGKEPVTIHLADGIYYLPETLVFTAADSGSAEHPVVWKAEREGGAVVSGGLRLDLAWEPFENGIFRATTPAGLSIDQVFVNGVRRHMARYPNFDPAATTQAYQGFAADAFSKQRAAKWSDPVGGYIHAMHRSRWGGYHYRITGKKPDGSVAYEGGWQNNRQMGMHPQQRMVENLFEELDAPGEWFHDAKTDTLYYQPHPGEDLEEATVEVVRLPHLIEFRGSAEKPVAHLTLRGLVFRHTARTFMQTREPLLRSDWTIYRGGAVVLAGTEDVAILDSEFDQPGGNAVFFSNYNRNGRVEGCHIHDCGASGVCFVGDPGAVRDPLFEYGQTQDLLQVSREAGPKTPNYPADCVVEDCLVTGIGRVERQPAGVQISMAARITVRDCSIYDCARAGINISEGTWGGHLIEGCDVFKTVQETHDHGSFNSWGRDRFWHPNTSLTAKAVAEVPDLPLLDAVETTVIRHSRWRCDHGWDIDLDDGSSNYEIHHNLMLGGGLKFREGYHRRAWNNILINNGFHPHVWYPDCHSAFERNIVMAAHADIRCAAGWTDRIDHNFHTSTPVLKRNRAKGGDTHSLAGDPKFVDPAAGDFRVAPDSPALEVGFENFPMDRFGVKKASLKAIAATPEIPALRGIAPKSPVEVGDTRSWLGAKIHSLRGEEFSAFGTRKEDGGVQLTDVPAGSAALQAGLRKDDLIQRIDGKPVRHSLDLFRLTGASPSGRITVDIIRDQKPETLRVAAK